MKKNQVTRMGSGVYRIRQFESSISGFLYHETPGNITMVHDKENVNIEEKRNKIGYRPVDLLQAIQMELSERNVGITASKARSCAITKIQEAIMWLQEHEDNKPDDQKSRHE